MGIVFRWAPRRLLHELTEVASTTGRLFHALMTLWLRSRRHLSTWLETPWLWPRTARRPCILSQRWKNWCECVDILISCQYLVTLNKISSLRQSINQSIYLTWTCMMPPVKFDTYRHLKRHRTVLPAIARLSCFTVKLLFQLQTVRLALAVWC